MVILAMVMATLLAHVGEVVGCGSNYQVLGVDAGGSVALVEDMHPFRDLSHEVLVGESMGANVFALDDEVAVATAGPGSSPEPAATCLLDLRGEAFKRSGHTAQ